jgi:hypothetical protein
MQRNAARKKFSIYDAGARALYSSLGADTDEIVEISFVGSDIKIIGTLKPSCVTFTSEIERPGIRLSVTLDVMPDVSPKDHKLLSSGVCKYTIQEIDRNGNYTPIIWQKDTKYNGREINLVLKDHFAKYHLDMYVQYHSLVV